MNSDYNNPIFTYFQEKIKRLESQNTNPDGATIKLLKKLTLISRLLSDNDSMDIFIKSNEYVIDKSDLYDELSAAFWVNIKDDISNSIDKIKQKNYDCTQICETVNMALFAYRDNPELILKLYKELKQFEENKTTDLNYFLKIAKENANNFHDYADKFLKVHNSIRGNYEKKEKPKNKKRQEAREAIFKEIDNKLKTKNHCHPIESKIF